MEDSSEKPLALVFGAVGFLGSWCAMKLLETGKYRVRGTVKDSTNLDWIELLKKGFGDCYEQIEFVSVNLHDQEDLNKAIEGVTYVLLVEFPAAFKSSEDAGKEMVKKVLKSCVGTGVRKMIITSSAVTCQDFWENPEKVSDHTTFVKEREDMMTGYKAKIRAERYVFDFIDKFNSKRPFDVIVMNPGMVFGKALIPYAVGGTSNLIVKVFNRKVTSYTPTYHGHVDVQDWAQAHINAIEKGKNGDRFPLSSGTYKLIEFFRPIMEEYEAKGYKIAKSELTKASIWYHSFWNSTIAFFYTFWDVKNEIDGSLASKELGIQYKPMEDSVLEACESLINFGLIAKP